MEMVKEELQDISFADLKNILAMSPPCGRVRCNGMRIAAGFTSDVIARRFRDIYETQLKRGPPSAKAQYDYAWCLVRSPSKADMQHGIAMLEDLFSKTIDEAAKRDYLFFLSVGHTRLKEYDEALKYCIAITKVEPRNVNAICLRRHIEKCRQRDGIIGMAIVGGTAALAVGAVVGFVYTLTRRGK